MFSTLLQSLRRAIGPLAVAAPYSSLMSKRQIIQQTISIHAALNTGQFIKILNRISQKLPAFRRGEFNREMRGTITLTVNQPREDSRCNHATQCGGLSA